MFRSDSERLRLDAVGLGYSKLYYRENGSQHRQMDK